MQGSVKSSKEMGHAMKLSTYSTGFAGHVGGWIFRQLLKGDLPSESSLKEGKSSVTDLKQQYSKSEDITKMNDLLQ